MPTAEDRQTRLAFFELGPKDVENLARLEPLLEKHADAFVAGFYRHLLSFEVPRSLLAWGSRRILIRSSSIYGLPVCQ